MTVQLIFAHIKGLMHLFIIYKGAVDGVAEVVYDYPDSLQLQQYRPKNDQNIELEECPAYKKRNEQPDIEVVDCPAYVEKKKVDWDIKLEECSAYEKPSQPNAIELVDCPAYLEKRKQQDIKLEECP